MKNCITYLPIRALNAEHRQAGPQGRAPSGAPSKAQWPQRPTPGKGLSLIHISEPTRLALI
eukprot:8405612-Alexandrium_andersonii.AAC.1